MPEQEQPPQISRVMPAFRAALAEIKPVGRSETADTGRYSYSYSPLWAVLDEVKRVCALHDLAVTQSITHDGDLFAVSTQVIHSDGGNIVFPPAVLPMPREAQALGSAATYLRRYSLLAIFGMGNEDDDGKAASVSATTQPGRRTEAERMIREEIGQMTNEARAAFITAFKEQWGVGLSDLPANRHGEALTWTRGWVHEPAEAPVEEPAATVPEPTPGG